MCETGPRALAGSLVGGASLRVSCCRGLGVQGIVLVHWCVWLGPGPCGGQGQVRAAASSGSLRTAGWWAKLFAWPEVSQYWCQQSSGWVWVSELIS